MTLAEKEQKLLSLLLGNTAAFDFCWKIAALSECWDDLIDKDKPMSDQTINAAFYDALVAIPSNAFYQKHFDLLQPVISNVIVQWLASNEMVKSGVPIQIERAHFLRYLGVSVWVQAAFIIGGSNYAVEVTPQMWEMTTQESLMEFNNEVA